MSPFLIQHIHKKNHCKVFTVLMYHRNWSRKHYIDMNRSLLPNIKFHLTLSSFQMRKQEIHSISSCCDVLCVKKWMERVPNSTSIYGTTAGHSISL